MGVKLQQSTNDTASKGSVVPLLWDDILKQGSFSSRTDIDYADASWLINDIISKSDTVKLRRSKRWFIPMIMGIAEVIGAVGSLIYIGESVYSLFSYSDSKRLTNLQESLMNHYDERDVALTRKLDYIKRNSLASIDASNRNFKDLKSGLTALTDASDRNLGALNRNFYVQLGSAILNYYLNERNLNILNYGLQRNFDLISHSLGVAIENYYAIKELESKVDRIESKVDRIENKVDRNFVAIQSGLDAIEHDLSEIKYEMTKGFRKVLDFIKHSKIEGVTSQLITFLEYFVAEKDLLRELAKDQLIAKLEGPGSILHYLQASRTPQSVNSLHALLHSIINQRFAIPENSDDKIAFTALILLCYGTENYVSVMSFLLEGHAYLADIYYQESNVEKYNQYFSSFLITSKEFKNSLSGSNGLIDKVVDVLHAVKELEFINTERKDIAEFASKKIVLFHLIKSQLTKLSNLPEDKPLGRTRYDFSISQVETPIGKWQDRRKVSYAVQFQSNSTYYQVGRWSIPFTINGKANPLLDIGTGSQGRTRLIFRRFDNDKPELVGVVENCNERKFRDINRDLYNAALEPNENIAINEIETLINNGADINAKYEKGRQAIHAVVQSGNSEVMLALIRNGTDVNSKDTSGYAPIHVAAEVGYDDFIKVLVSNGADVNARTNLGWTPLHIAVRRGYEDTIKSLIQSEGIDVNAKSKGGFTPLHLAAASDQSGIIIIFSQDNRTDINARSEVGLTPLQLASTGGHNDVVETLLKNDRVDVNVEATGNLTALHFASSAGNLEVTRLLIGQNCININAKSIDGWTPLHLAVILKKEDIALELLSDENIEVNTKGQGDLTPLHLATVSGQKNIISRLLDRAALIEDKDQYNYTSLNFAAENGSFDMVEYLVEKGADLHAKQIDGYTSLDLAAINGKLDVIEFLINKGASVNVKNRNDMAPIDTAALNGYLDIVKFLIDKGAIFNETVLYWATYGGKLDVIKYFIDEKCVDFNVKGKNGNVPLHLAALNGWLNVARYLVDEKYVDFNQKNNDGNTPLHLAALKDHLHLVKYFIEKRAYLEAVNNLGNTPLHLASTNGKLDAVKYLLRKGSNLEAENSDNSTPLHVSASVDITKYLVEKGANLRAISKDGYTPLHVAAANGKLDVIKYLHGQGSSIHTRVIESYEENNNGKTALHLAAQNGKLDVVEYLIEEGADVSFRDDSGKTSRDLADQNGHTDVVKFLEVVQLNLNLLSAVKQSNFNKVREYISQGASLEVKDKNGDTLQEIATINGNVEIAEFLEQTELDLNLVDAVKQGNLDMVKKYISKGASLEAKDKDGHSLPYLAAQNYDIELFLIQAQLNLDLMNAVKQDNLDLVKYISKEASLEIRDKNGNTLLHLAASSGHLDTAKYLIENRADFNATNKNNSTPLHAAVSSGMLNVVEFLIEEKEVRLEVKDKNGNTPLSLAAQSGYLDVVKYLAEKGADIKTTNDDGKTPLHLATANRHIRVKRFLEQSQLDLNLIDAVKHGNLDLVKEYVSKGASLDAKDKDGNSLLDLAAENNDIVLFLQQVRQLNLGLFSAVSQSNPVLIKEYISRGASLNFRNHDGRTPLLQAVYKSYWYAIKYLVENGADLNISDHDGRTPLFQAVYISYWYAIEYLVENGADLNIPDFNHRTPLFQAVYKSYWYAIKYLVDKGSDLNICDLDGRTPLFQAVYNRYLHAIKYLVEKGADLNVKDNNGITILHQAANSSNLEIVRYLVEKGADINAQDNNNKTPSDVALEHGNLRIADFLQSSQHHVRHRRHKQHHREHLQDGKHSHRFTGTHDHHSIAKKAENSLQNDKIDYNKDGATSGASKPSLRITDLFSWAKEKGSLFVSEVMNSVWPAPVAKLSEDTFYGSTNKNNLEPTDYSQIDMNGTILLIDTFVRKITEQKYVSNNVINVLEQEAFGYAFSITQGFEKLLRQAAKNSKISLHRLDIDFAKVQEEVTRKIMGGKFDKISWILNTYVEKACPDREAGCAGKLSPKKFNKFMTEFNSKLDAVLYQSMQQMLSWDSTLEFNDVEEQQGGLEPKTYLNITSIQGHLTQRSSKVLIL